MDLIGANPDISGEYPDLFDAGRHGPADADLVRKLALGRQLRAGRDDAERELPLVALLTDGATLLMFPEGTRSRTGRPGRARPGVAIFARDAGVPIVPAHIAGSARWTTSWLRGGSIVVRFGDPLPPPAPGAGGEAIRAATDEIMRRILALSS